MHNEEKEKPVYTGPSKSSLKRDAKSIEDLVWKLIELGDADLPKLEVCDEILQELILLRSITSRGAQKRQIKHLAGSLRKREDEVEWLRAFITGSADEQYAASALQHELEALRDRLVNPEESAAAYAETCSRWPLLDGKRLRGLQKSVLGNGDKKAYRDIFRLLRKAAEDES